MARVDEEGGYADLDWEEALHWVYPTNYEVREYQRIIAEAALYENTLVCLPTGMGKTLVASVVMHAFYRWFPQGAIVFLYDGNVACKDSGKVTAYQKQNNELHACLNKGDMFFVFDPVNKNKNPSHINLYKATAVYSEDTLHRGDEEKNGMLGYADAYQYGEYQRVLSRYKTHVVESDIATNWMHDAIDGSATFYMYKFFPHVESTYNYVAECSNRGLCNTFEGTCECFPGYTGDGCREQEALTL